MFLSSALLLSLALLAGRVAGFVRELVLASTLGVSVQADLAVLLLTLPDLLVNLLLSGGLSIALIPALKLAGNSRAAALFRQASLGILALFGLLALSVAVVPSWWFGLMAPGIEFAGLGISQSVFVAVALALPLTALAGVSSAYLNANDRFFLAGCGTLVFNLCVIFAMLGWQSRPDPLTSIACGVLVGALMRWLVQLAGLPHAAWRLSGTTDRLLTASLLKAFAAGLSAASLLVLVPLVLRALASFMQEGSVASFNYATKLVELPTGILITTLATVAYPQLSEFYARGDREQARASLCRNLQRATLLSCAVVLVGLWFADSIVALLFLRGKVSVDAASQIVRLTQVALVSVPFVGISSLLAASLNAAGRTITVLKTTLICLIALPLFALPGVVMRSPLVLMAALAAFQAALAWGLARQDGMFWMRAGTWLDARMWGCLAVTSGLGLLGMALDSQLDSPNVYARSAMAVALFLVSASVGLRLLAAGETRPHRSNK